MGSLNQWLICITALNESVRSCLLLCDSVTPYPCLECLILKYTVSSSLYHNIYSDWAPNLSRTNVILTLSCAPTFRNFLSDRNNFPVSWPLPAAYPPARHPVSTLLNCFHYLIKYPLIYAHNQRRIIWAISCKPTRRLNAKIAAYHRFPSCPLRQSHNFTHHDVWFNLTAISLKQLKRISKDVQRDFWDNPC